MNAENGWKIAIAKNNASRGMTKLLFLYAFFFILELECYCK